MELLEVYSFGRNTKGVLGHSEEEGLLIEIPKRIPTLQNIKSLGCTEHNTVCLNYNGEVFTFGSNEYLALGIGKDYKSFKYTHIPQKIDVPSCKQISCGSSFVICLTETNELYSHGSNKFGELGDQISHKVFF